MDEWLIGNGINFKLSPNSSACYSITYHMCFVRFFAYCLHECNFIFIWHPISVAHLPTLESRDYIFFGCSILENLFRVGFVHVWWVGFDLSTKVNAADRQLFFKQIYFLTISFHLRAICILLPVVCRRSSIRINILHLFVTFHFRWILLRTKKNAICDEDSKAKNKKYSWFNVAHSA